MGNRTSTRCSSLRSCFLPFLSSGGHKWGHEAEVGQGGVKRRLPNKRGGSNRINRSLLAIKPVVLEAMSTAADEAGAAGSSGAAVGAGKAAEAAEARRTPAAAELGEPEGSKAYA